MSYASKLDQLIGERIAEYEDEQLLKRKLASCLEDSAVAMCSGYPCAVYHPRSISHLPEATHLIFHPEGLLSNGVPRILGSDMVDGYPLGVYNPRIHRLSVCRRDPPASLVTEPHLSCRILHRACYKEIAIPYLLLPSSLLFQ
jgi:hypothetical protein